MFQNPINSSSSVASPVGRTQKFLERNYKNNLESDYTEVIEELCKNFQYNKNSRHYWSEPELSLLYGTPLYEQCSEDQKLVLNHLFWTVAYRTVADSETEATRYNLVTAGSFTYSESDYQSLTDILEHETEQEYIHIKAFYKVAYQVYKNTIEKNKKQKTNQDFSFLLKHKKDKDFQFLANSLLKANDVYTEQKELKEAYNKNLQVEKLNQNKRVICPPTQGFFHTLAGNFSQSIRELSSLNWGSSPFLGSSFYLARYMANLWLKNFEHKISKYYVKLQKQNKFIPEPTSISRYHFLDEAFHTTTSLKLGRDFYKELSNPSEYEKYFVNVYVYAIQLLNFGRISGIVPNRCVSDSNIMPMIYDLLRSQVFNMSVEETLYWMEQCFCHEHHGFETNKKYHNRLFSDLCQLTNHLDYLWLINKKMDLVKSGGSIQKAVEDNTEAFKQFSNFVRSSEFA